MMWVVDVPQVVCSACGLNYSAPEWLRLEIAADLAGGRVLRRCGCGAELAGERALVPLALPREAYRRLFPDSARIDHARAVPQTALERLWVRLDLWRGSR